MRISAACVVLALCGASFAPAVASAGDAVVSGRGPRLHSHHGRWLAHDGRRIAAFERPVVILVDDFRDDFGPPREMGAPPLVIRVDRDVEIVPLEDGGFRLVFGEEED